MEDYLELDIPKQLLINDIQCRISNYGAANLSGKKNYQHLGRLFPLRQSALSFTFFDHFLGMDNLKEPDVDFNTPCNEDVIRDLLVKRESSNKITGFKDELC